MPYTSVDRFEFVHFICTLKRPCSANPRPFLLWFYRCELDGYSRYHTKGAAQEFFVWVVQCRVKIPLPPIEVQRAIVALYTCAEEARKIASEAKELLKKACPAMVQSAAYHKTGVIQ